MSKRRMPVAVTDKTCIAGERHDAKGKILIKKSHNNKHNVCVPW